MSKDNPGKDNTGKEMEIPEELMEELYTLIYHTDLDGFERIERAITRIGKAYADGELELPGHELYLKITPYLKSEQEKVLGVLREELRVGDILITLRPLTGTGKEEEK